MKTNNNMNEEIQKKLNSVDWSVSIADSVISRKERTKRKLYGASITVFAAASLIVIFLFPLINNSEAPSPGENIISRQINGIYKEVFSSAASSNQSSDTNDGYDLSNEIDSAIDKGLLSRIDNF